MATSSIERVRTAARELGLAIEVREMPASTRTAVDAAAACGCDVDQIVKSLVFQAAETGDGKELVLLLVSGGNSVDVPRAEKAVGHGLTRADPKLVKTSTGFAIGGVSPIGHMHPLRTYIDPALLRQPYVWCAAGAPNAVFRCEPDVLSHAIGAISIEAFASDVTAITGG